MKLKISIFFICIAAAAFTSSVKRIKPLKSVRLHYNEPSEICNSNDANKFVILADKAFLFETDGAGKMIRKSDLSAYDIEGACLVNNKLYVSEESLRQILVLDAGTLQLIQTIQLQYQGPRNLAFESITYLPGKNNFLLATEKNPCVFYQYSDSFLLLNQFTIPGIREVSSITYHNNFLYVLSDEQATVFKVDPSDYSIKDSWKVPIINPEGICFNSEGQMMIVSDDMGKLFFFSNNDVQ